MSQTHSQYTQGPLFLSWPALALAFAVALALLAGSAWLLRPTLLTGPWGAYLLRDELDDYAFASRVVLQLRERPQTLSGAVLIGTAAMREGLLGEAEAGALLSAKAGAPARVVALMTGGQSGLEMASLAMELAPHLDGVLVLGVSPSRLAVPPAELASLVHTPPVGLSKRGLRR